MAMRRCLLLAVALMASAVAAKNNKTSAAAWDTDGSGRSGAAVSLSYRVPYLPSGCIECRGLPSTSSDYSCTPQHEVSNFRAHFWRMRCSFRPLGLVAFLAALFVVLLSWDSLSSVSRLDACRSVGDNQPADRQRCLLDCRPLLGPKSDQHRAQSFPLSALPAASRTPFVATWRLSTLALAPPPTSSLLGRRPALASWRCARCAPTTLPKLATPWACSAWTASCRQDRTQTGSPMSGQVTSPCTFSPPDTELQMSSLSFY